MQNMYIFCYNIFDSNVATIGDSMGISMSHGKFFRSYNHFHLVRCKVAETIKGIPSLICMDGYYQEYKDSPEYLNEFIKHKKYKLPISWDVVKNNALKEFLQGSDTKLIINKKYASQLSRIFYDLANEYHEDEDISSSMLEISEGFTIANIKHEDVIFS